MKCISEERVREIHKAKDLSAYSREELQASDGWVKDYAMKKLALRLKGLDASLQEFVKLMARCHYGSAETDEFLQKQKCYPEWLT